MAAPTGYCSRRNRRNRDPLYPRSPVDRHRGSCVSGWIKSSFVTKPAMVDSADVVVPVAVLELPQRMGMAADERASAPSESASLRAFCRNVGYGIVRRDDWPC